MEVKSFMASVHLDQPLFQLYAFGGNILLCNLLLNSAHLADFLDNLLDTGMANKQHAY